MKINASVSIQLLSKYSDKHFRCACLCAKSCDDIENKYSEGGSKEIKEREYQNGKAYAVGSIVSSVAYLEANINEFLIDIPKYANDRAKKKE